MKIYRVVMLTITVLSFIASIAFAADFYGASVIDKDVPTITWKAGVDGIRPIVNGVEYGSPASKAGFKNGDIILSINNKDVKRSSDLIKFNGNTLNVKILNGTTWNTLTIDKVAIEAVKAQEKANQAATVRKVAAPVTRQISNVNATQDSLPPLKFDDAALEKMYGKTTPAELARQRQIADRIERADKAREREQTEIARRQLEIQLRMAREAASKEEARQQAARAVEAQQAQRQQTLMQKRQIQEQQEEQQEPRQKQYFLTNGGTMTQPAGSSFSTTSKGETYFSPEGSSFSYGTGANAGKNCFHFGAFADCK